MNILVHIHIETYLIFKCYLFGKMYRKICFIMGDPDSTGKWVDTVGTNTINRKWKRVPSLGVRTKSVWAVPATPENSEQKQHHYCFANFI